MKKEPPSHTIRNGLIIVLGIFILSLGCIVIRDISLPSQADIMATPTTTQPMGVPTNPCAYVWASKDLPELTEELNTLYESVKIPDLQVSVSAFGENCLNEDGSIREFLTRQTDLTYNLQLDASDRQAVSDSIEKILGVLAIIPENKFPGPNAGEITFQFSDAKGQVATIRGGRMELVSAYKDGKRGGDLLSLLDFP